jgi:hypothetical protein
MLRQAETAPASLHTDRTLCYNHEHTSTRTKHHADVYVTFVGIGIGPVQKVHVQHAGLDVGGAPAHVRPECVGHAVLGTQITQGGC